MEIGLPAIIFLVYIVISVANALKKQAEASRAKRGAPQSKPGEISQKTRRMIYGEDQGAVREARPREAKPRQRPPAQAQELIETLFGVQMAQSSQSETEEAVEEGEWEPVTPTPRPEMQQRPRQRPPQRPAPPPVRRREVVAHSHQRSALHRSASRTQSEYDRREAQKLEQARHAEAQAHKREEQLKQQRKAQEQARKRKAAQVSKTVATAATSRRRRGRLFEGAHEVRKAIVFAEILGPPKGLENQ